MFITFTKLLHIWALQGAVVRDRATVLLFLLIAWMTANAEIYVTS